MTRYQRFRQSKLRHAIWPIRSFELFKFTPMALLMFTILLNQNIVRSLKDSLIVTYVGPEVISFIKLWGEMPLGVLFVVIYSKLCDLFSPERAFRMIVIFFMAFFTIFAFVLYPNLSVIHPNPEIITHYVSFYPHLKWFIIMWGKWSFVLMYILGELWTVIVFTVLFWQLANKVTHLDEAARFYPFFTIFGQANCLIAGSVIIYFTSKHHILMPLFSHLQNDTEIMIKSFVTIILASAVIGLLIQNHIEKKIILKHEVNTQRKEKIKLGVIDSFKLVARSPYLICIVMILISYSFSINLIEGIWMLKATQMFPDPASFIKYQGKVLFWTGVFTIFCAMVGSSLIRKFGWASAAILTPIIMLITGSMFFSSVIWQDKLQVMQIFSYSIPPLMFVIIIGAIQNVLSKGIKYSLYDATKEMAYIPLSDNEKTKGKAAADIVGVKIGKSLGAAIQIFIFTIFPSFTYEDIADLLMAFFVLICIGWMFAVMRLSKLYNLKILKIRE